MRLTYKDRRNIKNSKEDVAILAKRYNISKQYVYKLRKTEIKPHIQDYVEEHPKCSLKELAKHYSISTIVSYLAGEYD